jgi:thioredoxin-related protein
MRAARTLLVAFAIGVWLAPAAALELVMFRRAGCPWCAAFDREIAPVYPRTDVGRGLPLRQVELDRGEGARLLLASPVRFTPTFVLVDGNREIGRIEGYPGEDFFWARLEQLAAAAAAAARSDR